jgi:Uma2 family endonuclease
MGSTIEMALDPERNYEIVNGEAEEKEMPGARHSGVCGRLFEELVIYLRTNRIGFLYPEATFQVGNQERIPNLAYISAERIPTEGEPETKWLIVPDLAIEVVSPTDFYEKVHAKAMEYLNAGVKVVWIISPENQIITVYRSASNIMAFPSESELTCEDLLPGFRCKLSDIFKSPKQT